MRYAAEPIDPALFYDAPAELERAPAVRGWLRADVIVLVVLAVVAFVAPLLFNILIVYAWQIATTPR